MKYFLFLTLAFVGLVAAQVINIQKPVECADTAILFRGLLSSDYKEKPMWSGTQPGATLSRYSLFVNEETKSWTLIQFDEKLACVLGTGESSTRILNGPKI